MPCNLNEMKTPNAVLPIWLALACVGGVANDQTTSSCEDNYIVADAIRTREDVEVFVRCAAEYLEENGEAEALRAFNEDDRWLSHGGEYYVFVDSLAASGEDSLGLVFPPDRSREGAAWGDLTDDFGSDLVGEIHRVLSDHHAGWVHYAFTNPATGITEPKASYVVLVDWNGQAAGLGAGIYESDLPGTCQSGEVNAAALEQYPSDEALMAFVRCAAYEVERAGLFAARALTSDPRWRSGSIYVFGVEPETEEILFSGSEESFLVSGSVSEALFEGRRSPLLAKDFGETFWYYLFTDPASGALTRKVSFVKRVVAQGKVVVVGSGYYQPAP